MSDWLVCVCVCWYFGWWIAHSYDSYIAVLVANSTRCENLADLIWQNRQQIKKVELLRTQLPINVPTGCQDLLPILNTTITGLLSSLVTRSFIMTLVLYLG